MDKLRGPSCLWIIRLSTFNLKRFYVHALTGPKSTLAWSPTATENFRITTIFRFGISGGGIWISGYLSEPLVAWRKWRTVFTEAKIKRNQRVTTINFTFKFDVLPLHYAQSASVTSKTGLQSCTPSGGDSQQGARIKVSTLPAKKIFDLLPNFEKFSYPTVLLAHNCKHFGNGSEPLLCSVVFSILCCRFFVKCCCLKFFHILL
jgi:hypothetical protein